jgi:hypothetical protein
MRPDSGAGRGYETSDISVRGVFSFAVGLIALGVVVHFVLGLAMQHFAHEAARNQAMRPPQFSVEVRPPEPRLQGDPAADLVRVKQEELERLNTYGWMDREHKIAHIPIERAMDLLARDGLPARGGSGPASPAARIEQRIRAEAPPGADSPPDAKEEP